MATRKPFQPKPWGVGDYVSVDGRGGVVWSPGPLPASVWVLDADGAAFAVKKPTRTRPARILDGDYSAQAAARDLRYAETIRRGVLVRKVKEFASRDFRGMPTTTSWAEDTVHASADCPLAQGDVLPGYNLGRIAYRALYRQAPERTAPAPALCRCLAVGVAALEA